MLYSVRCVPILMELVLGCVGLVRLGSGKVRLDLIRLVCPLLGLHGESYNDYHCVSLSSGMRPVPSLLQEREVVSFHIGSGPSIITQATLLVKHPIVIAHLCLSYSWKSPVSRSFLQRVTTYHMGILPLPRQQ